MQQSESYIVPPPPAGLPKDPVQRAWVAVQKFGPALLDKVEARVRAAGFPPLEWYDVLWAIEREGPLRQRDLAANMLIARYSISRLVDRMEAEGLVERRECPSDARGQMVHLTDAGRALRRDIWTAYGPAMNDALSPLSQDECVQLAALLAKLG